MISEFEDFSSMDLDTVYGELQEHKIALKRLVENEEGDKKKKNIALKLEKGKESGKKRSRHESLRTQVSKIHKAL